MAMRGRYRGVSECGGKHQRPVGRASTLVTAHIFPVQELRAANETLRTLQTQLELVPSPSSSTIKVLMDTKDARIATLEREVNLLEREVERLGGGVQTPAPAETPQAPFKRQVSFLLNDVQIGKDGTVLGRL